MCTHIIITDPNKKLATTHSWSWIYNPKSPEKLPILQQPRITHKKNCLWRILLLTYAHNFQCNKPRHRMLQRYQWVIELYQE